jgi:hypothetical protein
MKMEFVAAWKYPRESALGGGTAITGRSRPLRGAVLGLWNWQTPKEFALKNGLKPSFQNNKKPDLLTS